MEMQIHVPSQTYAVRNFQGRAGILDFNHTSGHSDAHGAWELLAQAAIRSDSSSRHLSTSL